MKTFKRTLSLLLAVLMAFSVCTVAFAAEEAAVASDEVTGFTDEDFDNVIKNNPEVHKNSRLFPRDKLIRMAGNSIPVKLLEGIFYQVRQIDDLLSGK